MKYRTGYEADFNCPQRRRARRICGLLGLLSGLLDQTWKLGTIGWFTGGILLLLITLFVLLDAAIALQKARIIVVPKS